MKKIAVIGLGSIGKRHIANIKTLYPDAKILGVSSSGTLSQAVIKYADELCSNIEAAINFKPDFAVVASPATYHLQHARLLIKENIPVLIEKPITVDQYEAKELFDLACQYHVSVSVAYCLRYLPAATVVKNMLEQQQIGSIYNISSHVGQYLPDWRQDKDYRDSVSASKKLGGGVLLELSHELDYLQWLTGDLEYQFALLRNTKELDLEVEEIADLFLTTPSGAVCTIHMDFLQKNTQRYCRFIGATGHIYWDLLKNQVSLFKNNQEKIVFNEPDWPKNNMYLLMLEAFAERVKRQDTDNISLMSAQRTAELIDTIKSRATWGVKQ
jgi:predicted dehydrogenase